MTTIDGYPTESDEFARPVRAEIDNHFIQAYRRKIRESQKIFWARFGVTQSRGSRFELGANIPKPVMILLKLYFEGRITDDDIASVSHRRSTAHRPFVFNRDLSNPFGSL